MANPLHDNPASKAKNAVKEDPREDEGTDTEVEERGTQPKVAKDGEGKPEERGGKETVDGSDQTKAPDKGDMFLEGLKDIHKRQETQRRDHHQAHREATRKMTGHHAKEIADHFSLHFGADGKSEGTSEKPAAAPAAGGEE